MRGVQNAIAAGWHVLANGGSSLDAVEAAVVVMEDDEAFDAGRGSFLNREGKVQLDALIMDGATLRAGGVGCVEHVRNPVRAARKVLETARHDLPAIGTFEQLLGLADAPLAARDAIQG